MGRGMVQASYPIPHFVSHLGNNGREAGEGRSELLSATCLSWDYSVTVVNLLPHSPSFPKS